MSAVPSILMILIIAVMSGAGAAMLWHRPIVRVVLLVAAALEFAMAVDLILMVTLS